MAITVQEAQVIFSADGMTQVKSMAGQAGAALDGVANKANLVSRSLSGIRSIAGSVAGQLTALGAGAAVGTIVKLAADAENASAQFRVLTGSAEAAEKVLSQINRFAAETPFQTEEIRSAARSMIAFGSSSTEVIDELRMLGDISSATGQPLNEIAELYGKARVQGRLFAVDINQLTGRGIPVIDELAKQLINQLTGRGIPVIDELAKQLGVAKHEVMKLVEKGAIGFPEMQRALAGMTGPGGQFAGMMSEMSQTTAGKFSTFVDNMKLLGIELGEVVLPYANQFLTWANNAVGGVDGVGNAFRSAIDGAVTWYNQVSGFLQDVGVIVGVVIADAATIWEGFWADIQSWAAAALDWIMAAVPKVMESIGNMIKQLNPMQIAAAMANPAILGGFLGGAVGNAQLPEFTAPTPSDATMSVAEDIARELSESRRQREQESSQAGAMHQTQIAAQAANQDFVSQQKTASGLAQKTETPQSQKLSAEAFFNSVQGSLQKQALDIAKRQEALQAQTLTAAQQTAAATQAMLAGVPTTLG